jgi:16S rRNA (guanine(966)-N(2))-methyltransferase RsmD
MMRIITGRAKGVRLVSLEGDNTRPTGERAKMAIFSMLQFEMEDRHVLDLFSGSGQMGLEAISRGAANAVLVDRSKDAIKIIEKNAIKTKLALDCEILCADYADFLRASRGKRKFDLVFLDPPYAQKLIPDALSRLFANGLLSPCATVVCEAASQDDIFGGDEALAEKFEMERQARYGSEEVAILRLREDAV